MKQVMSAMPTPLLLRWLAEEAPHHSALPVDTSSFDRFLEVTGTTHVDLTPYLHASIGMHSILRLGLSLDNLSRSPW